MNGIQSLTKALSSGALMALLLFAAMIVGAEDTIKIGSDSSTESSIIAEIVRQTVAPERSANGPQVLVSGDLFDSVLALIEGRIDVYPIGLDRLAREIVVIELPLDMNRVNEKLASQGLGVAVPLGFKRAYSLAVPEEFARSQRIKTISDVLAKPKLRYGFSTPFMTDRGGFARLTKQGTFRKDAKVKELKHDEREAALKSKQIDVIEVFATDPAIRKYRLTLLTDDQGYFSSHDVVLLHRLDVAQRHPSAWDAVRGLENALTENDLLDLNWRVDSGESKVSDAVTRWRVTRPEQPKLVKKAPPGKVKTKQENIGTESEPIEQRSLLQMAQRHLLLVFAGLVLSVLVGVPLGIWASTRTAFGRLIFAGSKLIGITPFLALLVFSYVLWREFGPLPAILALFAYGLWPIVAHTVAGLRSIPPDLIDAATLQNLTGRARLRTLDLPMAMGAIAQGIQRGAVVNVGTATVAALFGAGGFGDAIIAGLTNENLRQMLTGAIPVTVLAVAIYFLFGWVARAITPIGVEPLSFEA